MWFMPGYEFTATDGGTWPVLAIDESYVQQVAPTQPIPEPAIGTAVEPAMTAAPWTTALWWHSRRRPSWASWPGEPLWLRAAVALPTRRSGHNSGRWCFRHPRRRPLLPARS